MCCSQGSEGRSSIGRRLAAVAAGVVATALMLGCSLAMGTVANAQEGDSPVAASQEGNGNKHFMVYYRAWRDVTMKGVNTDLPDDNWISMYDIPYGIDVVNVFSYVPSGQEAAAQPFYDKLKSDYAPYLHARGINSYEVWITAVLWSTVSRRGLLSRAKTSIARPNRIMTRTPIMSSKRT